MASGVVSTSNNHLEITYEAPWGGVASDKNSAAIEANQLVDCDGVCIKDEVLCYSNISSQTLIWNLGVVPLSSTWSAPDISLIFNCANYLCGVDEFGISYIATTQTGGQVLFVPDQVATDGPSSIHGTPTAVKVVDGVAYISVYSTNILYAYTPTVSYVIATNYAAGLIIDIFNEQLIQLNTNSLNKDASDGMQPTRINWSAPDEFSVWDPSVNRLAGYQSLTSVEDYISGFVAVDNVGYIFKRSGVTQITSTGVAIQPFSFTTFWNSTIGQGLIFFNSLVQYGRFVFLTTDSNVYRFYGGAFTPIGDAAKSAIFSSFNINPPYSTSTATNNLIAAGMSIYAFNDSNPHAYYVLITATSSKPNPMDPNLFLIIFWFFDVTSGTWTSLTRAATSMLAEYITTTLSDVSINFIKAASVYLNQASSGGVISVSNLPVLIVYINFTYTTLGVQNTKTFVYYHTINTLTAMGTSQTNDLNLTFKAEELKMGRVVTFNRVLIKANGIGTLNIFVSGINTATNPIGNTVIGTQVVLDGTAAYKIYYSSVIFTGAEPQLSITSTNFNGQIVKVMIPGTYADGDVS